MKRYRDNIDVKQNLDKLQSGYECCGDTKYTDWFRVSWVADEFVDISDPDIRDRVRSGSGYQSDDVPFSCCDRAARRPCITQFIHDNKKHFNYDYRVSIFSIMFVSIVIIISSGRRGNSRSISSRLAALVMLSSRLRDLATNYRYLIAFSWPACLSSDSTWVYFVGLVIVFLYRFEKLCDMRNAPLCCLQAIAPSTV